ncbi:Crp/Fnr family transcriptional regulator [Alkalibacter mobilis]|uniref:Crp/Fnr family transcriptional regulator n=1 Tax=Alkalibacter mobilis TaxID=2787712 RepID=UPI00189C749A|nr:Crp/Fnr family transcriptional regulator [Alkalibacter mobilis]MBF7096054.1 Crp/Fnr family transcriptional regulator [Alkalibacter mobilis]
MNIKILQDVSSDTVDDFFANGLCRIERYEKNRIIHLEGSRCVELEIVLEGIVAVERIDPSGNLLTIAEFRHDDMIGGNLLFSRDSIYPMTVTSKEDSKIFVLKKDAVFRLCSTNQDFLRVFLESISENAFILGDKIRHHVKIPLRESLRNYILTESKRQMSKTIILPVSKTTLAQLLGVARTSLSRELQKMSRSGLIEFDRNTITLNEDIF